MTRREFVTLLGLAATLPFTAHAQQAALPIVGFLNAQRLAGYEYLVAAFQQGLKDAGFVDGQNVTIDYRWAEGQADRLPVLAKELIGRHVAVIVAAGGANLAAQEATSTIPVVATFGGDPVSLGLVKSLNRPGGNVTGMTVFGSDLDAKRLELLQEVVPRGTIGVLLNPTWFFADSQRRAVEAAASAVARPVRIVEASNVGDLEKAFAIFADVHVAGIVVAADPFFNDVRDQLLALASRFNLPAIYETRRFATAGGLMSYGTNVAEVYYQIGRYAGRVLGGEKPADLPILQPEKFDMIVNLQTARALGLSIPTSILLRADEVIE